MHLTEKVAVELIDTVTDALIMTTTEGQILLANKAAKSLFGQAREDLAGKDVGEWLPGLAADWFAPDAYMHAPGSSDLLVAPRGGGHRAVAASRVAFAHENTTFILIVLSMRPLESVALDHALATVWREGVMAELANSIAHELNQPLTALALHCDAALMTARSDDKVGEEIVGDLESAAEQAFRASKKIDGLRGFLRGRDTRDGDCELNASTLMAARLVDPLALDARVDLTLQLQDGASHVAIDQTQLGFVLVSLMRGAIAIMAGGDEPERRLHVSTSATAADSGVTVVIEHSGAGLSTTVDECRPLDRDLPGSLNLDLSICRSIVAAHGGRLWNEAAERTGAGFGLWLPAAPLS